MAVWLSPLRLAEVSSVGQAQAGRVVAAENKQGLAQLREERVTIRTASFTGKRFNSLNLLTMKMRTCSAGNAVYICLVKRASRQGRRG